MPIDRFSGCLAGHCRCPGERAGKVRLGPRARGSLLRPEKGGTWSDAERQAQVVRKDRGRVHALVVASCWIRYFAAGESTVGVLTGLAMAGAETAEVVEGVALNGRIARELGEEAAAARLDGELTDDRIFTHISQAMGWTSMVSGTKPLSRRAAYMSKMSSTVMEPLSWPL